MMEVPLDSPGSIIEHRLGISPVSEFDPPIVVVNERREVVLVGGAFSSSSAPGRTLSDLFSVGSALGRKTTSTVETIAYLPGIESAEAVDAISQLAEARRILGISVERLARLVGCSRQAFYGWQNGENISFGNRERVAKLLATLQFIDRGSSEQNQELLVRLVGGRSVFDLLEHEEYDAVRALVGGGSGRQNARWVRPALENSPFESQWYDRLVASDESTTDSSESRYIGREGRKRLQLKKG